MWLFKFIEHSDIMAIACNPEYIACGLVGVDHNNSQFSIKAFKHVPFNGMELAQQIIFNPTRISKILSSFFEAQKICNISVRISLHGPSIVEHFITIADKDFSPEHLNNPQLKNLVWESTLIETHNNQSTYYVSGISRHLLFQYKLLAIEHKLNIECISTRTLALLSMRYATRKNRSQDLLFHNFNMQELVNQESLYQLIPGQTKEQNPLIVAELVGLAIAGLSYENI